MSLCKLSNLLICRIFKIQQLDIINSDITCIIYNVAKAVRLVITIKGNNQRLFLILAPTMITA